MDTTGVHPTGLDTTSYARVTVLAASCVLGGLAQEDRRAAVKKILRDRKPATISDDALEVAWEAALSREAVFSKDAMEDSRLNFDSWLEIIIARFSPPEHSDFWSQSTPSTRRAHFAPMFDLDPGDACFMMFVYESAYCDFGGIWLGKSPAEIPMMEDWQDFWRERALVRLEEAWIHRTRNGEEAKTGYNKLRDHNWQTASTQDGNPLNVEAIFGADVDLDDILQAMPVIVYTNIGDLRAASSEGRKGMESEAARANMESGRGCRGCGATNRPLLVCSKCKRAKYCSQECQKTAWKTHKKNCKKD